MAKVLFASQKPSAASNKPLSAEELITMGGGLIDQTQADKLAEMDRKAQEKAIGVQQGFYKEQKIDTRQGRQLGMQAQKMDIANYKDFNKSLQDTESKFDDAQKQLSAALAQFKANPNKSSLQQLAVSMARAGGDTGVLSNQDLAAYKLSTIAQDFEGLNAYITDNPDQALTPSVQKALTDMAEFGLSEAGKRKTNRLKSLYENNVSVFGKNFLKDEKPDVMKNWEKRLGLEAVKTDQGIEVKKQIKEYTGNSKRIADLAGTNEAFRKQADLFIKSKGGQDKITDEDVNKFQMWLNKKKSQ
jgi:hypothetical protein